MSYDLSLIGETVPESELFPPEGIVGITLEDLSEPEPPVDTAMVETLWDYDSTPVQQSAEIGTNVTLFAANRTSDVVIFTNQLKGAWPWIPNSAADTVSYDENGYVTDLGEADRAVSSILKRSSTLDGIEPFTGSFRLYGQGEGMFSIGTGLETDILGRVDTAELSTEVIDGETYWYVDFDYASADADGKSVTAKMFLNETAEGNHIREMSLVHQSHLELHRAGETFAPEFLEDLAPYSTLRFMDWMNTNVLYLDGDGRSIDPELRHISTDHFTFNTRASGKHAQENVFAASVPIEYIVELANAVQADAWINLPADITDARAEEMARYVRDTLDTDLDVYWEYGNEVWNGARGFNSYDYAARMGADTFDTIDGVNRNGAVAWAAYRGPQLYDLIDSVFDADDDGVSAELHFVAPMWAYSGPVRDSGQIDEATYSAVYFAAAEAQAMPDAPSRPADIVTDYAVGLYYGAVSTADQPLTSYLLETYDTAAEQAEATAKLQLFGLDAARSFELSTANLDNPVRNVSYEEGINIGLTKLIWADYNQGLDMLRDLTSVLRLDGTALQYRGVNAEDWTTVLTFDAVPAKSLEEMILDIEILGYGFKRDGKIETAPKFNLANNENMRLEGHLAFVESLGLNFISYEGGPHIDLRTDESLDILTAYFDMGYSDIVFNAWFAEMTEADVDLYMDYMSHDRYARESDFWGTKEYVGQPLEDGQSASFLYETIAMGVKEDNQPVIEVPLAGTSPASASAPAPAPAQSDSWEEDAALLQAFSSEAWSADTETSHGTDGTISLDGKATLTSSVRIPVDAGGDHTVSFRVADNDGGKIRVIVTARGDGSTRVGYLETQAEAGDLISLDLDSIPAPHDRLDITIRRVSGTTGTLTLEDFHISGLMPDAATEEDPVVTILPEFDSTCWSDGDCWSLEDGTAATSGKGILETTVSLDGLISLPTRLDLDIAGDVDLGGRLRIVIRASGGGSEEVLRWEGRVEDGDLLSLDLDEIPEQYERLNIIIRRTGTVEGELRIMNPVLISDPVLPVLTSPVSDLAA